MKAKLVISDKYLFDDGAIVEIKVWQVPTPVPPSGHGFKYRLFYGYPGQRIVAFDNERGKGDHRHIEDEETAYAFVSIDKLLEDFFAEIDRARGGK